MNDYAAFLARKQLTDPPTGLSEIPGLPAIMFDFQRDIARWALRRGRAALFAGTGLGKSLMELVWADAIRHETGQDILILAPLAVSTQMIREAVKFGIAARQVSDKSDCRPGINVTNYQKLDHFDLSRFGAVILDESSILKSVDGHYRTRLIEECADIPYRLAATATPAPNDYMELGNHAEFLGIMSYTDMLATFFTHDGSETQKWRLKGHAEGEFWRWMASWSVMLRKPSDLGYENGAYELPPLVQHQHSVSVEYRPSMETGLLFPMEANGLQERLAARRDTIDDRVRVAVDIVISSFRANLAACGNQNTKRIDEAASQPILPTPPVSNKGEAGRRRKTRNTCANTIGEPSSRGSKKPKSSVIGTTQLAANDTHPTQSSPSNTELTPEQETRPSSGTASSAALSALAPLTMPSCSPSKAASAQSAEPALATEGERASTSTIAMKQVPSGVSFAAPAILVSANSPITPTDWLVQSNIFGKLAVEPWVIWCHLNTEQDALEKAFGDLAISIRGNHTEIEKERLHQDWLDGRRPVLITKPSMFGHGLNWQHCCQTLFVGLSDSFEQVFQAIRRFWRFGQTKPVNVHFVAAETEGAVVANLRRKEIDADRMAAAMILHMADLSSQEIRGSTRTTAIYAPTVPVTLPDWIGSAA